ncbi:MAG TPA: RluA family pseudouridine synthase [Anaerolineales bacterium]|nr:RluA family pseudouridine synthase [Anaerolineales bacterium]HUS84664.1 RluA family pseudouridine synthase [Anaerolineales bacterium]
MDPQTVRFLAPKPGGRLDVVIVEYMADLSRSQVQKLIRNGSVSVDRQVVKKTGYSLDGGEDLRVSIPEPTLTDLQPEAFPIDVIYEDQDLLVVNKEPGVVVHPSVGHATGTLVQAVLAHAPNIRGIGEEGRPGVVHRLDKDTSGLILFAKHDKAHQWLQQQFQDRHVKKVYYAITDANPPTPSGKIDAPIGRDSKHRQKMAIVSISRGREAVTTYHTHERFHEHSFLEVRPETGRTHQIRVHLAFIDCPIVGDRVYGRSKPTLPAGRQMLHAGRLSICLLGNEQPTTFNSPLPEDFEAILNILRQRS